MMFAKSRCFQLMENALSEPVRIDCGPDVARVRQCFYRARQSWGDDRFIFLRFQIDGTTLVIDRHPDPDAVRQRYKLRALREAVIFALSQGARIEDLGIGISREGSLDGEQE